MTDATEIVLTPFAGPRALPKVPSGLRSILRLLAQNWEAGRLSIGLPSGEAVRIEGRSPGPSARMVVRDFRFVRRVLTGGHLGFAEGYLAGEWESPDLPALLEVFSANFDRLSAVVRGHPLARLGDALAHAFNANSRRGSRRNIRAHYDLGNAFYAPWLDAGMTYSSALYAYPGEPLEAAQAHKYAALSRAAGLERGCRVLEIGCGWGGFAQHAAADIGCDVTGLTLSTEQHAYAAHRLAQAGLADRARIALTDYRDVEGTFDRIISIEMFEAVGQAYWPVYFRRLHELLRPGGRAGLQVIVIRDDLVDGYGGKPDFIQKHVFPGGMLPSEAQLRQETARAGLVWGEVRRFGQDYAETLAEWAKAFEANWPTIRALGFDERFHRLWRYYLGYCEAGFRTGRTDVIQLTLDRP